MKGLLITNGTLLNEDKIKELVFIGWDCITFSIDGPDAKTHDYLRGLKGSFDKLMTNLKLLKKIKTIRKTDKPIVRFNIVLSNRNYNKVFKIFQLAYNHNCIDVQIQPMTVWGKTSQKLRLNNKQTKEFQSKISKIKAYAASKGILTNINSFIEDALIKKTDQMDEVITQNQNKNMGWFNLPCFEPWYNMIILPNGAVAACSISGGIDGDTINGKTLKEVWFGKSFNKLRKRLLNNDLPNYCKKCCVAVHIENRRIKEKLRKCMIK